MFKNRKRLDVIIFLLPLVLVSSFFSVNIFYFQTAMLLIFFYTRKLIGTFSKKNKNAQVSITYRVMICYFLTFVIIILAQAFVTHMKLDLYFLQVAINDQDFKLWRIIITILIVGQNIYSAYKLIRKVLLRKLVVVTDIPLVSYGLKLLDIEHCFLGFKKREDNDVFIADNFDKTIGSKKTFYEKNHIEQKRALKKILIINKLGFQPPNLVS